MKLRFFFLSYFGYKLKIKASITLEHVTNNQEHAKNTYDNIQGYQEHLSIFKEFK